MSVFVCFSCGNLKFNNSGDSGTRAYVETQIWNCILKSSSCFPQHGGSDSATAISMTLSISYSITQYSFAQNVSISPIQPAITETVTSCIVSPALPSGLTIDNTTCVISGTPTTLQTTSNYSITATNAKGSANASIGISVVILVIPALVQFEFSNGSLADSGTQGVSLTTAGGSPTLGTGFDGGTNGSYSLGGSDYFTTVIGGDLGLPMGANPRTMCAWINPSVAPSGNSIIFRYGLVSAGTAVGLGFQNANLAFFGSGFDALLPYTISTNTWSHFCATFDGSITVSFYINGSLVGAASLAGSSGPINTTSDLIIIGGWDPYGYYWIGGVDDVRIYGLALSPTSINQIYQGIPVTGP